MRAILMKPGCAPAVVDVEAEPDAVQAMVGPKVRGVNLDDGATAWVDDDQSDREDLAPARVLPGTWGPIPVRGTLLVTRHDEEGALAPVTDADVSRYATGSKQPRP